MTRELNPFLCCFGHFFHDLLYHFTKEQTLRLGTRLDSFRGCKMLNQNCRAKTHVVRMCWTILSSWSQRGQCARWGSPLFCRQSAVRSGFKWPAKWTSCIYVEPMISNYFSRNQRRWSQQKKALYAGLVEKIFDPSNFHCCWSRYSTRPFRLVCLLCQKPKNDPGGLGPQFLSFSLFKVHICELLVPSFPGSNRAASDQTKTKVFSPLPMAVTTVMANIARVFGWTGISRPAHGQSDLVISNHSQSICRAHPMMSRLCIPSPPRSVGLMTFSQATKKTTSIYLPYSQSLPQEFLPDFVNCSDEPLRHPDGD